MYYVFGLMMLLACPAVVFPADDQPAAEGALWTVRFKVNSRDGESASNAVPLESDRTVSGRVLIEAVDGGLLIEDRAGRLWNITPEQIVQRERTSEAFEFFAGAALGDALRAELGDRFQIVRTEHYVIATSGNLVHAQWCGTLLERLLPAFLRYWIGAGLELSVPPAPLVVVVHGSRDEYAAAARDDGGAALTDAHGYYSMRTNRMMLADATADARAAVKTRGDLQRLIAADPAPVSTLAHEATHQIAFNSGMHTRYADNPVWLTEGMAMLFEIPDLSNSAGWRTVGRLNRPRLLQFRESLRAGRPVDSLTSLIADDERFRNPESAEAAYAEAWALTHFLVISHRRELTTYLKECSGHTRLLWKTRAERLEDFQRVFGTAPDGLEDDFLRATARLR